MTDERFNNLSTYRDTVQSFFSPLNGYDPLNQDDKKNIYAVAFLVLKAPTRTKLHKLQLQSCEIIEENKRNNIKNRPQRIQIRF